ncbi:Stress-induced-phosphoprotein 1 [Candida viswanathii]|uniref:RNA polymerase II-associated protein 3 n=1 Tax=Candida viswanathii TaxID=5486 RepID=A0A367YK27_9ASCO|nr:Stress-induced-phosphoprotein 1 [Candida viswanathii]
MSATQLKDQGNKAFAAKDYPQAIQLYTSAISIDKYNPVLYSNRAQCYLNLHDFHAAYTDCTMGLDLPNTKVPVSIKLNFRKGMALKGLQRYSSARVAFEAALRLDPGNDAAKSEIKNLPEVPGDGTDVDVKIPIEEVDELPQEFANMLKPPAKPKIEHVEPQTTSSSALDKEIDELFGSKKSKATENKEKPKAKIPEDVQFSEKLPMHFLTALKQLPDSKKINGYKYVVGLDAESYQTIFEPGIDAEFLLFFLDAANYVSSNNAMPDWNNIILDHLKQFSSFKRYDLAILMCDDSVKKSILQNVKQQYPNDAAKYEKYI